MWMADVPAFSLQPVVLVELHLSELLTLQLDPDHAAAPVVGGVGHAVVLERVRVVDPLKWCQQCIWCPGEIKMLNPILFFNQILIIKSIEKIFLNSNNVRCR